MRDLQRCRVAQFLVCAVTIIPGVRSATPQAAAAPGRQTTPVSSDPHAPGYQLQVQVPLVLEDLVVVDHDGTPVHGLKASDLAVTDDRKPVTLQNFQEHTVAREPSAASLQMPDLGPNTFTNLVAKPAADSWNIFLLDVMNTPMADQAGVRQQMLKYLGTLPPGRPVAIFQLDTQLRLLQGFTADPELLRAAIEKRQDAVRSPRMMDRPVSDVDPMILPALSSFVPGLSAQSIQEIQRVEGARQASGGRRRALFTAQALIELGRYVAGLPGRKNLIWFSASFPPALPDFLVRNRVAVYPVDLRGLMPPPVDGPVTQGTLSAFAQGQLSQHAVMANLAESTGGKAFYDNNAFKEAVETAISDGDNYYTFSYTPPDREPDGSYRRIAIKAGRPGLKLSYRSGYFAVDPITLTRAAIAPVPNAPQDAMRLGAPAATQILFEVTLNPADATVEKITAGSEPDATMMKPPYRRYDLVYRVDIRGALFTTSRDGLRHGSLDFAVFVYSPQDDIENRTTNRINLDLPQGPYIDMLKRGLSVGQTVEAPAKGDYFLRIAVYDPNGDRVGATEVSTASLQSKREMLESATKSSQPPAPK